VCGICSSTGVLILANQNDTGLQPNPNAGPLTKIVGPDYTGPRITYINASDPTSWPTWITAVNGAPVDTGAPGGTFQAQTLATLDVTAASKAWLLFLALVVVVAVLARK
jgi:hypothetical protein